jgi:hypothetical protein
MYVDRVLWVHSFTCYLKLRYSAIVMLYEVVNAGTITQEAKNRPIWNRCYDFKKIFAKNIGGK